MINCMLSMRSCVDGAEEASTICAAEDCLLRLLSGADSKELGISLVLMPEQSEASGVTLISVSELSEASDLMSTAAEEVISSLTAVNLTLDLSVCLYAPP